MSLIMHYFLHSTSVLSFYIDVVLTLSIIKMMTSGQAAHIWGLIMPPPLGVGVIIFSGCPSACPSEAPNTMFCLYTDPMVHLTIHDHFSACPSFCPSVWPERFPDISRKMHRGNDLQFCILMYPDHFQNWLDFGHGLLILLILALLWLR